MKGFTIYGRGGHLGHVTSINGPRSRNDLDLQYSDTSIYLIRCQLLLTFMSLAAIVSEKSNVFTFPIEKP